MSGNPYHKFIIELKIVETCSHKIEHVTYMFNISNCICNRFWFSLSLIQYCTVIEKTRKEKGNLGEYLMMLNLEKRQSRKLK